MREFTGYDVIQPIREIHAYVGDCLVVDHNRPDGAEALYHLFRRYGEIASYTIPPSLMYLLKKHAEKLQVRSEGVREADAADHAKPRPSLAVHTNPRPVARLRTARPQLAVVR